jgi:hypothetical protein
MGTFVWVVAIAIVLVLLYCGLVWFSGSIEEFANKQDKATTIYHWFVEQEKPRYNNYRNVIEGDIVEYSDLRKLRETGKFTVENILKVI